MQATSQDPDTSRLMGINVDRIIMVAFALGAALAAVAGLAYGLRYTNIDFKIGFLAGLKAFTAAVLGGIGNINGAVVGGLVLGVVEVLATIVHPRHLRRLGLEGRLGVRAAHPGAGLPAARSARREGGGPGMRRPVLVTPALQERHGARGRIVALVGGARAAGLAVAALGLQLSTRSTT